ncbi:MAG: sugar MFS transporter [Chloroflexia bacterium]|nr:sugar MFS transporter [Chloroflexia bacterium]
MKRNYGIVVLVLVIFFVISFLTNIMGALLPLIKESFKVGLAMASLLPLFFFIAYGVMSIPAGILVDKYKEKKMMVFSFGIASLGAILFALFPRYEVSLISLFMMGAGMAILQVAINPLLRESGGEEHFAFFSVMGQLFFGAASFVSPWVSTDLVERLKNFSETSGVLVQALHNLVPEGLPWTAIYWVIAVVAIAMTVVIIIVKIPQVVLKDDEKVDGIKATFSLFKNKTVILFFIGIFAYVGTEQGLNNWMSEFLKTYHGLDPLAEGKSAVSFFWGLLTLGCFLGLILLKFMDSRLVLKIFSIGAIASLIAALTGSANIAQLAFPLSGFFLAVMWSIVFSLALNSVEKQHGTFAGILCTGIAGGAIIPFIIGLLGDAWGLRIGMTFLFITLGYILSVGFWAKPIVNNKTISLRKKEA